jgi:hypothetical protein
MALNAYNLPYSLKRLSNLDPSLKALPGAAMNAAVSDVAGQEARKQAVAEAHGGNIALGEKALSLRKMATQAKTQLGQEELALKQEELDIQRQTFETAKDQARRGLFLTAGGQLLKLGGAWMADKEATKIVDQMKGMMTKYDEAASVLKNYTTTIAGQHRETTKKLREEAPVPREESELRFLDRWRLNQ